MDEPTTGLDPLMEAVFQECIHRERDRGRTVLLSSHILSEVEALCDRVSIIRAGAVVETGTLSQLRHLTRTTIVAETRRAPAALSTATGVHDLVIDGAAGPLRCRHRSTDAVMAVLTGSGLLSLTASPPTLEELFLRHYGDQVAARRSMAGRPGTVVAEVSAWCEMTTMTMPSPAGPVPVAQGRAE